MVEQVARPGGTAGPLPVILSAALAVSTGLVTSSAFAGQRNASLQVSVQVVDPCDIVLDQGAVHQSSGCGATSLVRSSVTPSESRSGGAVERAIVSLSSDASVTFVELMW